MVRKNQIDSEVSLVCSSRTTIMGFAGGAGFEGVFAVRRKRLGRGRVGRLGAKQVMISAEESES